MHLLVPAHQTSQVHLMFNVDGAVGAGAGTLNAPEDVLLVQFLLKLHGLEPGTFDAKTAGALRAVQINGVADAGTIGAITAFQDSYRRDHPAWIVDGRVSVARDARYATHAYWTIAALNGGVRKRRSQVWPRLQDIPGCPPIIAERCAALL